MGWSQLKNQDSYLSIKPDWDLLLINAGAPALPNSLVSSGSYNPTTQITFGWTFSRMGYKGSPTSPSDFNNKSIGAFRVSPTVYTFSFYYRDFVNNPGYDDTKIINNTPTVKPNSYLKKLGLYYNKPKTFKKDKVYQFNTTLINYLQIGGNPGLPDNPQRWRSPILYMVTPLGDKSEILAEKPTQKLNNYESSIIDTDNKKSDTFILPWPFFASKASLNTIENTTGRIFNIHYYSSPNEDVVSYFNERPTIFHSSVLFGNSHTDTAYKDIITTSNVRKYEYKLNGKLTNLPGNNNKITTNGEGIVGHVVNETDWLIQGFSYVSLYTNARFSNKPWTSGGNLFGNGWYVLPNSYVWYDIGKPNNTPAVWQNSSFYKYLANDPYYNMPVGGPWTGGPNIDVPNWVDYYGWKNGDTRTTLSTNLGNVGGSGLFGHSKSPHEGFRKNNYIARYINQDKFNMSFKYQNDRGDNTGLKFYLSDTLPSQKPINNYTKTSYPNKVINDLATITDIISVSSSGNEFLLTTKTLKEIKVTINLQHSWDGDLIINLKGPRENDPQGFGKVINLFNREGGNSDNFVNTVFSSDDNQKSIYYGTAPFIDTFKMKKDIGAGYATYRSNTKDIKELLPKITNVDTVIGNWTLYIKDDAGLDFGQLTSWSIEFIFDNTSNISYIGALTQSVDEKSYNFYGLQGNQYIIFVADALPSGATYTVVKLNYLGIEDSYHPQNNTLVTVGTNSLVNNNYNNNNNLLFTPTGINGNYSYDASVGVGNTLNATQSLTYSVVHTRAGTGRFTSGIWENGNWINGWREDTKLYQFFNVQQFFSYNRDKKWRFTIIGPSYHTSQFNIGDKVSISNVVAIDINEERKLIKNYFTIINKTFNSLVVEFEFDFPIRRVQRDSDFHFINVTKNIWLNGNFFNGYFKGIWTNGLFYGYPFITEMYNSHWVDGIFKGGHFKSNPVSLTFKNLSISGNNLVVNFSATHSFNTGDSIYVNEFIDEKQPSVLFGDSIVTSVIDNSSILTSLSANNSGTWSNISLITGGYVKSNKNTALIQNINIDTLNISSVTSNKNLDDRSVFSYNTWLDLVFDETSATNIFKPQTNLNSLYPIGDGDVYYSNNNLYGYTTLDVLSSDSKFRDSFSNVFRNYKLGTKYKIFHDYIGDSSYFDDYFINTDTNSQTFKNLGWKYNSSIYSSTIGLPISFERTVETTDDSLINGKELRVTAQWDGGVLNLGDPVEEIPDRYTEKIKQNRYTMIEFDLVSKNVQEDFFLGDGVGLNYIPLPMEQPSLHFGNLNLISRKIISPQTNNYSDSLIYPTFLPIYKNINHTFTPNKKKSEYFYNKRDLMMTFRGSGSSGKEKSEYVIDNLKLYEVDMIPFFQYFTYENINRSVQIPIESKTPYKNPNYFSDRIINLSRVSFDTSLSNVIQETTAQVNTAIFNSSQPGNIQSS
jgi:subtilisin-like proprotein convertase family protein